MNCQGNHSPYLHYPLSMVQEMSGFSLVAATFDLHEQLARRNFESSGVSKMNLQMFLFLTVYRELFTVDCLQPIGFAENLDEVPDIYGIFLL